MGNKIKRSDGYEEGASNKAMKMRTDGGNQKENINNCDNINEEMRGENKTRGK